MIRIIPDVLDAAGVAKLRSLIDAADWTDGNETSGPQAALAKQNQQLPEFGDTAAEAGRFVLEALGRTPLFIASALPLKIYPPYFNRYTGGDTFGDHIDNAIRMRRGSDFRMRADLSATLFLADPDSYEGGGLVVEGFTEAPGLKLPAGHLVLYPSTTVHRVEPVTSGSRIASFMWIQSMIRDQGQRNLLFDLDMGVQGAAMALGQGDQTVVRLTGVYHNLLRRWADS
ncbi:Fe2+-dependent dioxygenase [Sphingopyxis sp.]|uniref:Fe2+-dependent dioxygenase n=1 Tax=Sphingopyxis sp. TaxID=1908224 RepID=UPI003BAA0B97